MKIKKLMVIMVAALLLSSCTEKQRVRNFGGSMTIDLPRGQRLMMATWKGDNLFYLLEPMDEGYIPKRKVFKEDSSFGVLESNILFIESK